MILLPLLQTNLKKKNLLLCIIIFESLCKTGGCYANTVSQKSLSQGPYDSEPGALFKHDGRLFYSAAARATVITSALPVS